MPSDQVNQVYVSLLKSHEATNLYDFEAQQLSIKSLDILIKYLPTQKSQQHSWVNLTIEILNKDFQNINNNNAMPLIRFWQIFLRNHEIFFHYR